MRKDLDENHLPEINRKNKFLHDEAESHVRIQNTLVDVYKRQDAGGFCEKESTVG